MQIWQAQAGEKEMQIQQAVAGEKEMQIWQVEADEATRKCRFHRRRRARRRENA